MRERIVFSWSGGKDSSMALFELQRAGTLEVASLLTTVSDAYDRISMHGVRRTLLERQADALGLPLHVIRLAQCCTNDEYESKMSAALAGFRESGIRRVAFGDIFLADLRAYRERNLARVGMTGLFPVWQKDTRELVEAFLGFGFRAIVVCVDAAKLDDSFAGRLVDREFVRDLPAGVDPCGENGEFHSFVFDGPIFREPVGLTRGAVVRRGSLYFCDLLPARGHKKGDSVCGAREGL